MVLSSYRNSEIIYKTILYSGIVFLRKVKKRDHSIIIRIIRTDHINQGGEKGNVYTYWYKHIFSHCIEFRNFIISSSVTDRIFLENDKLYNIPGPYSLGSYKDPNFC